MAQMAEGQAVNQNPAPNKKRRTRPKTGSDDVSRLTIFLHALFFVLGFTFVFTLLGSAAGLLGQSLNLYLPMIQKIGAILLLTFGLTTLGVFRKVAERISRVPDIERNPAAVALLNLLNFVNGLLYTEKRVTEMHNVSRNWGYLSSALMGVSFSAGWVPCVGPILASILFLASDSSTAVQGAILLAIFSLGLGIPFLITGAAFSSTTKVLRRINRHSNIIGIISGSFLLVVAYLLWTDRLGLLTTQFIFLNEWVFALEDGVSSLFGVSDTFDLSIVSAAPIALSAGLISFISPCVLPLIPAYLGYLSGASLSRR